MKNEIVFYGKVNNDTLESILYKAHLEPRMNTEWRKQMENKCRELGAREVRSVEYIGNEKPNFNKAILKG